MLTSVSQSLRCCGRYFATLSPQLAGAAAGLCQSANGCDSMRMGRLSSDHDLGLASQGSIGPVDATHVTRRLKCPKASSCLLLLACWPLLRPVVAAVKKNSSWLIPRPSRLSQPTPANTSNTDRGPALWPGLCAQHGARPEAPLC